MKFKLKQLIFPALIILYFLTRLTNLKIIPIFTDEAIYAYWSQIALNDSAQRFISLEDGKQPLFVWLAAILQHFISDPLVASRLVSTFAGFASLVGIYLLTKELFTSKVALVSSFLYVILPFTLLYDRMALFDSLLTMLGIYAVLLSIKMARNPKLDLAILNGFAIGLATITKSSGFIFLYLLPLSLILLDFRDGKYRKKISKWLQFSFITLILTQLIYNSLRLSPLFYIVGRKNLEFIRSSSEVISDPFIFFASNIKSMTTWIVEYAGILLVAVFLAGVFKGLFKKNLKIIYLSMLIFAPFIAEGLFNKVLYPRFMLFYFPFFIIVTAYAAVGIIKSAGKYSKVALVALIIGLISPVIASYSLLSNPPNAKIANSDSDQYINSWPAGYGVEEVREIIHQESKSNKVYVGTEGTFGLLPFALKIYFYNDQNVHLIGCWPVDSNSLPQQILDISQKNKTYFIFNENQKDINSERLKFISKYQKGKGDTYMRLYEVLPE